MATPRASEFFQSPTAVRMVAPASKPNQVNYARRFAESRHLSRFNQFMSLSGNVRVVVPANAKTANHAERFAVSIGVSIERSAVRKAAAQAKEPAKTMNPYLAARQGLSTAATPTATNTNAQKLENSVAPTRRKGRSL
ncbi:MAG TPA: hypothetical protein VEC35_09410 [Noviherbaspirillum sp.]|nr:hypothetical protein [Noviherbaspirillum sp.]